MEIMSEFKAGDKIIITENPTSNCKSKLKVGDTAKIDSFYFDNLGQKVSAKMTCDAHKIGCFFNLSKIKLANPKWSIYNNDLPWEKLSNKQKGKLLLAAHSGVKFFKFKDVKPEFLWDRHVYVAIKPEPVKPEPTMAELFIADWPARDTGILDVCADKMIAKGWAKPCK